MTNEPRLKALLPLWPWLPAFRAVAETEHLPSAARLVDSTPPSLSRAIALLERRLGRPLFKRNGRTLRLNSEGRTLLIAVRDAMRRCDDGVQELSDEQLHGSLTIASHGAGTTAFVAPALHRLLQAHPRIQPAIVTPALADIAVGLRSGRLDIAFVEPTLHGRELVTVRVGTLPRGIWCGPVHPLFGAHQVSASSLTEAAFVAPPPDADGNATDGWPSTRARRVTLTVDQLRVGVEMCCRLPLLAVLPDVLAEAHEGRLHRLPFDFLPSSEVHALHRRHLSSKPTAVSALLACLG
jgi:DNA-binding transcriptional LysR family regulator